MASSGDEKECKKNNKTRIKQECKKKSEKILDEIKKGTYVYNKDYSNIFEYKDDSKYKQRLKNKLCELNELNKDDSSVLNYYKSNHKDNEDTIDDKCDIDAFKKKFGNNTFDKESGKIKQSEIIEYDDDLCQLHVGTKSTNSKSKRIYKGIRYIDETNYHDLYYKEKKEFLLLIIFRVFIISLSLLIILYGIRSRQMNLICAPIIIILFIQYFNSYLPFKINLLYTN